MTPWGSFGMSFLHCEHCRKWLRHNPRRSACPSRIRFAVEPLSMALNLPLLHRSCSGLPPGRWAHFDWKSIMAKLLGAHIHNSTFMKRYLINKGSEDSRTRLLMLAYAWKDRVYMANREKVDNPAPYGMDGKDSHVDALGLLVSERIMRGLKYCALTK